MKNRYTVYLLLLLFALLFTAVSCTSIPPQNQEEPPADTAAINSENTQDNSATADTPPAVSQQPQEEPTAPAAETKPVAELDFSKAVRPGTLPGKAMNSPSTPPLPAKYRVRSYKVYKDTLRNIAARPWVYNDPTKWRVLYNANKSKLPQPNNPNLIYPGMILNIPSIRGEVRQGLWDPKLKYQPLRK